MTDTVLGDIYYEIIEVETDNLELVEVAEQGPPGPRGIQGPPGTEEREYIAAVAVSGHIAIVLDADGSCLPADCTDATHAYVVGVTTQAAVQGDPVLVKPSGSLEHLGWTFTAGLPIFLGLAGALTQTLPPTALFSKVLGVALSPTRIALDFQPAMFLSQE